MLTLTQSSTYHDDDGLYPDVKNLGTDGPIHVAHGDLIPEMEPFRQALKQAWTSKGQDVTQDVYNGHQSGLFNCVNSVYKGLRSDASVFVEGKSNITIMPLTQAKVIEFEGDKAVGITVMNEGRDYTFRAKHEVILSLGVYESPKLLLLSGIGPEDQLKQHGIDVRVRSDHVGQNLLDHPILAHCFRLKDGYGLDGHLLHSGMQKDAAIQAYRRDKTGPLSSGLLELVAFPRIDERLKKSKQYRKYVEEHNGVDPFGPAGQPHFEIDFVVRAFGYTIVL